MQIVEKLREGMRLDLNQDSASDHWRFSDLGKCMRYQVMKRSGIPGAEHGDATIFVFKMGHLIEKQALSWLRRAGVDILAEQVNVEAPLYDAKGHADALMRWGNALVVLEVKSTRNKALEYRIPYPNHILQASAYAYFLGLQYAAILYVGRDGALQSSLVLAAESAFDITTHWNKLNEHWNKVKGLVDSPYEAIDDLLPPRKPKIETEYKRAGPWGPKGTKKAELDPECGYCIYKDLCWRKDEGGAKPETNEQRTDGETENITQTT